MKGNRLLALAGVSRGGVEGGWEGGGRTGGVSEVWRGDGFQPWDACAGASGCRSGVPCEFQSRKRGITVELHNARIYSAIWGARR